MNILKQFKFLIFNTPNASPERRDSAHMISKLKSKIIPNYHKLSWRPLVCTRRLGDLAVCSGALSVPDFRTIQRSDPNHNNYESAKLVWREASSKCARNANDGQPTRQSNRLRPARRPPMKLHRNRPSKQFTESISRHRR